MSVLNLEVSQNANYPICRSERIISPIRLDMNKAVVQIQCFSLLDTGMTDIQKKVKLNEQECLPFFNRFLFRHPRQQFSASPIFTVTFPGTTKTLVTSPAG